MDFDYIYSAVAWSLGGFALGYMFARATADLHTIAEVLTDDDGQQREETMPGKGKGQRGDRVLGVLVIIMSLVTVGGLTVSNIQRSDILDCQARVNGELIKAISARSEIADADRAAMDTMILGVIGGANLPPDEARANSKRAIEEYVATIEESQRMRAMVHLPGPNDYNCGE